MDHKWKDWKRCLGRTAGGLAMLMAVCAVFASMGLYLAMGVAWSKLARCDSTD
jgi:hypothetical protein